MIWETPQIIEVKMDAEIGSYQEDYRDDEQRPAFATPASTPEKTCEAQ